MRYLFISPEKSTFHRYRRDLVFRIAGVLIVVGVLAQVPLLAFGVLTWLRLDQQTRRRTAIASQTDELSRLDLPLKDVRQQLAQIRQWEPIIRHRLPVSAILGGLEASIPDKVVIDSVTLEADQYDRVSVNGGTYRAPTNYRIIIQGKAQPTSPDAVQQFADKLRIRLPAEAELVRAEHWEDRSGGLLGFVIQYAVKTTGNYNGAGLTRITDPSSL
jgi:hypothetical protein